ncbi:MAG: class I SAM-dependent methyltransferase [Rhodothermales bacterium]|nr:class I SAM-dependent methyltransferase [Rhodothermales bacterium]
MKGLNLPIAIVLLTCAQLILAGCGGGPSGESPYTEGASVTEGGSGRFYMDREIAGPIESEHEAFWLDASARDVADLPNRLLKVLELNPSAVVADIGAGTGYFTFRLAREVPHGRVYAVDVVPALLDTIRVRATEAGLRNVNPVLGTFTDPNLPPGRLDLILIVASYHEFSHPREMLASMLAALKPGGRLAVVEYRGEDPTIPVPEAHRMTEEQIRREITASGFDFRSSLEALPQQHVLIFAKPVPSGA